MNLKIFGLLKFDWPRQEYRCPRVYPWASVFAIGLGLIADAIQLLLKVEGLIVVMVLGDVVLNVS